MMAQPGESLKKTNNAAPEWSLQHLTMVQSGLPLHLLVSTSVCLDGEISVDFQWHRVRPLTRIGGWASQEVDDESEEDVHGDLWYVFSTLESFVITCKLKSLMMEICFD
jgi:hypothetical protein